MRHLASPSFWECYYGLSESIQQLADKNFRLLKQNSNHPSLHFKKVKRFFSARIGTGHRALAVDTGNNEILWIWIGAHREYEKLIK